MQKLAVFRHGETQYKQGVLKTSDTPNDLTKKGVVDVYKKSEKLLAEIPNSNKPVIFSSPTGRTLHTANIIREVLQEKFPETRIIINRDLGEIKNFNWVLFNTILNGGYLKDKDQEIFIPKEITNPKNYNGTDYIKYSAIADIPENFFQRSKKDKTFFVYNNKKYKKIPYNISEAILDIELYDSLNDRVLTTLSNLSNNTENNIFPILVTHECFGIPICDNFNLQPQNRNETIKRSDYLRLKLDLLRNKQCY